MYQIDVAFPFVLDLALGGRVERVHFEDAQDFVVLEIPPGGFETDTSRPLNMLLTYHQVKTRTSMTPWRLSDLTARNGALRSLLSTFLSVRAREQRFTLIVALEGSLAPSDVALSSVAVGAPTDDAVRRVAAGLKVTPQIARSFLEHVRVTAHPSRDTIRDRNMMLVARARPRASTLAIANIYNALCDLCVSAMEGTALTNPLSLELTGSTFAVANSVNLTNIAPITWMLSEAALDGTQPLIAATDSTGKDLPRLSEVDPYLVAGVSKSKFLKDSPNAPYVARDVDATIDLQLQHPVFLIVVGPSKAGKSRTAWEALLRRGDTDRILIPGSPDVPLSALISPSNPWMPLRPGTVLWLDDLERFIGPPGLDSSLVSRLIDHEVSVVGTLRSEERQRLMADSHMARLTKWIFQFAQIVELSGEASPTELDVAAGLYPGEDFVSGIGETCVAAVLLAQKYFDGREVSPQGLAVAKAAADVRRMGFHADIPGALLTRLARMYLPGIRAGIRWNASVARSAFVWCEAPVASQVALLKRVDDGASTAASARYTVFDYVVHLADQGTDLSAPDIRDEAWYEVIDHAEPVQAQRIGWVAESRGRIEPAIVAFRKAALAEGSVGGAASHTLGTLLYRAGRLDEALNAFEASAARRYGLTSAMAYLDSAIVRYALHQDVEADAILETIIGWGEAGPPVIVIQALRRRARQVLESSDLNGALEVIQRAIDLATWSGHPILPILFAEQGIVLALDDRFEDAMRPWRAALEDTETSLPPARAEAARQIIEFASDIWDRDTPSWGSVVELLRANGWVLRDE